MRWKGNKTVHTENAKGHQQQLVLRKFDDVLDTFTERQNWEGRGLGTDVDAGVDHHCKE